MPAPLDVDKEQVRMLVLSVGVRAAAREMGIAEATVQYWSATGKWLAPTKPTPATVPVPASQVRSTVPTNPVDALANTLNDRHKHTRLGLSLYTARAARVASRLPKGELLARSSEVKAVADVAGKVWPEQQVAVGVQVNLGRSDVG